MCAGVCVENCRYWFRSVDVSLLIERGRTESKEAWLMECAKTHIEAHVTKPFSKFFDCDEDGKPWSTREYGPTRDTDSEENAYRYIQRMRQTAEAEVDEAIGMGKQQAFMKQYMQCTEAAAQLNLSIAEGAFKALKVGKATKKKKKKSGSFLFDEMKKRIMPPQEEWDAANAKMDEAASGLFAQAQCSLSELSNTENVLRQLAVVLAEEFPRWHDRCQGSRDWSDWEVQPMKMPGKYINGVLVSREELNRRKVIDRWTKKLVLGKLGFKKVAELPEALQERYPEMCEKIYAQELSREVGASEAEKEYALNREALAALFEKRDPEKLDPDSQLDDILAKYIIWGDPKDTKMWKLLQKKYGEDAQPPKIPGHFASQQPDAKRSAIVYEEPAAGDV